MLALSSCVSYRCCVTNYHSQVAYKTTHVSFLTASREQKPRTAELSPLPGSHKAAVRGPCSHLEAQLGRGYLFPNSFRLLEDFTSSQLWDSWWLVFKARRRFSDLREDPVPLFRAFACFKDNLALPVCPAGRTWTSAAPTATQGRLATPACFPETLAAQVLPRLSWDSAKKQKPGILGAVTLQRQ